MTGTIPSGISPARLSRYARLSASVGAVVLAGLMVPATVSAATGSDPGTATATAPSTVVGGVPAGFLVTSTSWTAATTGWALGFTPCRTGSCPALLSTVDGGQSWRAHAAPRVASTPDQTKVHFADDRNGWATDGTVLLSTHDGAATWSRVRLPGAVGSVGIGSLESTDRYGYAIVSHELAGSAVTQLYAAPLATDAWQPVAGVAVPGLGGWDIATRGSAAYVSLGVVHESTRQWSAADGATWVENPPLCSVDAAVRLDASRPEGALAMCSSDPYRGSMTKLLVESVGGDPVVLGQAPDAGITTGFASNPVRSAFVAGVGAGASWLHATFNNGATWETPLVLPDVQLPMLDLDFQDATHGVVVWGGPAWSAAVLYRTTDGGHTWTPLL